MGQKQKIIPHIPGTLDGIVESFFAKDKAYIKAKKKEETTKRNEKKDQTEPMEKERNAKDSNT